MVTEGQKGKTFCALKKLLRHLFAGSRSQEPPQPEKPEPPECDGASLPAAAAGSRPSVAAEPPPHPPFAPTGARSSSPRNRSSRLSKKRNAVRRLPSDIDLHAAFGIDESAPEGREKFSRVVEFGLTPEQIGAALNEKERGGKRPPETGLKRLGKRYPKPRAELDLHGCTATEAERKTASFILTSQRRRLKTVRIITGKGLHSDGYPVLPGVVESGLQELKEKKLVLDWHWEGKSREPSGALIVYLVS